MNRITSKLRYHNINGVFLSITAMQLTVVIIIIREMGL